MRLIATVRATAVSEIIDYNPAPVPGPVVSRRSALEASGHTHRTVRTVFCAGACPHRVSHIVVGERFGAPRNVVLPRFFLAHHIGRPLGRSVIAWGCLRAHFGCTHEAKKVSRLIEFHGFLPFLAHVRPSPDPRRPHRP